MPATQSRYFSSSTCYYNCGSVNMKPSMDAISLHASFDICALATPFYSFRRMTINRGTIHQMSFINRVTPGASISGRRGYIRFMAITGVNIMMAFDKYFADAAYAASSLPMNAGGNTIRCWLFQPRSGVCLPRECCRRDMPYYANVEMIYQRQARRVLVISPSSMAAFTRAPLNIKSILYFRKQ